MLHDGNIALVTGGASGIGRAAALAFAREGARVAVADIAVKGGEETVSMIAARGGEAMFVDADMRKPASIRQMVEAVVERFGGLDVAFNNAGRTGSFASVVECDEEEWDVVQEINVKAVWLCMKYEIPEMVKRGGGAIVNAGSVMSNFSGPKMAAYVASKHAVLGLTRSAAIDFGPSGVRVNALLPGATATPLLSAAIKAQSRPAAQPATVPLRRIGAPEDQAEAAVWVTSKRAAFINGAALASDGGVSAMR
ncbi:MAG: glucose 1-dehydrogenase [Amphiplicatus sp.]